MNGKNITCSIALTAAISSIALDNFNCLCVNNKSIFNDLTGSCIVCALGKINSITCKCPSGQDWNIFLMACSNINPPMGQYNNLFYAKCIQSSGLVSQKLIAYSLLDVNQVYTSG